MHIEKRGESHAVVLTEPQSTRQATDRLRFSDVQVLILGGAGDDSVPGLGEIGHLECQIVLAHTRTAEAAVDWPREQSFQAALQIGPHPVRKVSARDDKLIQRQRREVRGDEAVESDTACLAIHISRKKTGRTPATRNPSPARCNRQPPGPLEQPWQTKVRTRFVGDRARPKPRRFMRPMAKALPGRYGGAAASRACPTRGNTGQPVALRRQPCDSDYLPRQVDLDLLAIEIGDLIEQPCGPRLLARELLAQRLDTAPCSRSAA